MDVDLFGVNMFLQAEKAAFEEAEKKKEEEVNFDSESTFETYHVVYILLLLFGRP
jgi:hypothetical protein